MDTVNVRNLEQIQEDDPRSPSSRAGLLVALALGGAVLVTAGLLTRGPSGGDAPPQKDALADLVAKAKTDAVHPTDDVGLANATFPAILSDEARPTTALAAVTDAEGKLLDLPLGAARPPGIVEPPPATDRLPVVPLPTGSLLTATPVTTAPKDSLAAMARDRSTVPDDATLAPPGTEGGYQIQIASFKEQVDADALVEKLRKRGHSAYRQAAHVPTRGLWHRVRVGPFKSRFAAMNYKKEFERTERVSPFLVDPHKVAQQQEIRDAKVEARERRTRP